MVCRLVGVKPLSKPMQEYIISNLRNKLQWNLKRNSYIFIQENAFENVICEMAATWTRRKRPNRIKNVTVGMADRSKLHLKCKFSLVKKYHHNVKPNIILFSINFTRGKICFPDSNIHGANMGPTWVLSAPSGPHVSPINLVIRVDMALWQAAMPSSAIWRWPVPHKIDIVCSLLVCL